MGALYEDPENVVEAKALTKAYIEEHKDPVPVFTMNLLWHIVNEEGWRVYLSTNIHDYMRYMTTHVNATGETTLTQIFDGPTPSD